MLRVRRGLCDEERGQLLLQSAQLHLFLPLSSPSVTTSIDSSGGRQLHGVSDIVAQHKGQSLSGGHLLQPLTMAMVVVVVIIISIAEYLGQSGQTWQQDRFGGDRAQCSNAHQGPHDGPQRHLTLSLSISSSTFAAPTLSVLFIIGLHHHYLLLQVEGRRIGRGGQGIVLAVSLVRQRQGFDQGSADS